MQPAKRTLIFKRKEENRVERLFFSQVLYLVGSEQRNKSEGNEWCRPGNKAVEVTQTLLREGIDDTSNEYKAGQRPGQGAQWVTECAMVQAGNVKVQGVGEREAGLLPEHGAPPASPTELIVVQTVLRPSRTWKRSQGSFLLPSRWRHCCRMKAKLA